MTGDPVIVVVAWAEHGGRSAALAEALGAEMHAVEPGRRGPALLVPFRYVRQAVQTARLLRSTRPEVVVVQNPPIVAPFVVWLVQRVIAGALVIDSHTGAFVDPRWRRFLFLHRWLSRRARTTIVHNEDQAQLVSEWGVPWIELSFVPFSIPADNTATRRATSVLAVCSGADDEPLAEICAAARALPAVQFVITGREERLRPRLVEELPPNARFLGFVAFNEYLAALQSSTVVLALTTRDGTLVNGGFEAIAAQKPLVTSDSRVLRRFFSAGAVHTENTAAGIEAAVESAIEQAETLAVAMGAFAERSQATWLNARDVIVGSTDNSS